MALTLSLLLIAVTAPAVSALGPASPDEGPQQYSCDESGQFVCAGAEVGADIDCFFTAPGQAQCEWTYGQTMGALSPLMLPGQATFSWSSEIQVCLTDAAGTPIECDAPVASGASASCPWLPGAECVESLGPNPGETDVRTLETDRCLEVSVTASANTEAWTPNEEDALASASDDQTGAFLGSVCNQNNGR